MNKKIYVGNLPYSASEDAVKNLFSTYGNVDSVNIISDRRTGRPKGFCFVEMSTEDEANNAIQGLNGNQFEGRTLKVSQAKPKEDRNDDRPSYDRGGGGGYRSGGRGR